MDSVTVSTDLAPEYVWIDGGQDYVVCAYYTPDYLPHALDLKRSLEALGVNHFLKLFEASGDWAAGTRIKPAFLEDCLIRFYPKHVLYVDADAVVRQPLNALDGISSDIAMYFVPSGKHVRLAVGTIYVRNTPGARSFLASWRKEGETSTKAVTDSEAMHKVFSQSPGLTISILPSEYFGMDDQPGTVVQHFTVHQRSSKKRKRMRRRAKFAAGAACLLALCVFCWYFLPAAG